MISFLSAIATFTLLNVHAEKLTKFDHIHAGCPENSSCSKEMGAYYERFRQVLKSKSLKKQKQFLKKEGIPFATWSRPPKKESSKKNFQNFIEWDSQCANHHKKIFMAQVKARSLRQLKDSEQFIVRKALIENKPGDYTLYHVPRGVGPLYLNGQDLIYLKYFEGLYYGLSINRKGKLSIVQPQTPSQYTMNVDCGAKLTKAFKDLGMTSPLYTYSYCLNVWNEKTKRMHKMILGRDCD